MSIVVPQVLQPDAADSAGDAIIQGLAPLLSQSAYACGGSVAVKERLNVNEEGTPPVTIRWDDTEQIKKLVLPADDISTVQGLVKSTQPASFGLNGKDVIDESYRKASKLDPTTFSTNFCPYEVGIIDSISQALLPLPNNKSQGIRAELYKLNVYEGPSGMFKPHLDTPRSDLHFGSLVVCLPSAHQGGQLVVRHQGLSTTFDWSKDSSNLQWAAFYSDCEHEVSQVTSGYRLTLTYNLFLRRSVGHNAGTNAVDASQLPVYKEVQAALANPSFFPNGGLLGKYCSHAYAHATKEGASALPAALKGSDMVAYEIFKSLGVPVAIRPELDIKGKFYVYDDESEDAAYLSHSVIGKELMGSSGGGYEDCSMKERFEGFPHDLLKVKWLNTPVADSRNFQYSYLVYGNQAEIDWAYSHCVLLMEIPPYPERTKVGRTILE
ncbi:hypothetical protein C7974DRAFT_440487 [Boeremia exigua]|uniref:uncharacterized protein n=1 Tax=Boeremia exigua TaxID=749465 RepID=UPI001E8D060F|nr:uncharacterized protein C7974DRAFT_440487 [Boeremia exigua]KAH6644873.1 hypothetical protein C7974DRAFT_440487 [Boeremia exigua]